MNSSAAANDVPAVSIGIPVFNGEATIARALAAIQAQSFRDFELIISDNASTDQTMTICERLAASDPRIRLLRAPENLGAMANFATVLAAARGRLFMFAAADDWFDPGFTEEAVAALAAVSGAVACVPRTQIHYADGTVREARGAFAITGPGWYRVARFLLRPGDNSRFYGLYRTTTLRRAFQSGAAYHAADWATSALTLSEGAHLQTESIALHREGADRGKYLRQHQRAATGRQDFAFPLARMTGALVKRLPLHHTLAALPFLLLHNLHMSGRYLSGALLSRHRPRRG